MHQYVSAEQIAAVPIPLGDIYDLVEEGFRLQGCGEFELPAKQGIHPRSQSFLHAMPAYLPTKDLAGAKFVSVYPGNASKGVPTTSGVIVMLDSDTGIVTAILDAAWITNMRTAMASMVDARYLAATPRPVFGIVGAAGACGRAHLEAIAATAPGSRVLLNSRTPAKCDQLLQEFGNEPLDLAVQLNYEAIVKECDVLIVCTSYLEAPIFEATWLHAGQNVLNVHTRAWAPDITSHVDQVSCDNRTQVLDPANGLTGTYPSLDPDFELGDVVVGNHPGRESASSKILSFNYGLATLDLLVADYVLRRL